MEELNANEKRFVREYFLCDMDHVQAGENATGNRSTGLSILRRPKVKAAIYREHRKLIRTGVIASPDQVLQGFTQDAEFDPRDLLDESGIFIPLKDLPDSAALSVTGFECKEKVIRDNQGNEICISRNWKYKFPDKHKNRESLGKYHGIFEKDNMQKSLTADVLKAVLACLPEEIRETVLRKLGTTVG